jgi:hypothetical protein
MAKSYSKEFDELRDAAGSAFGRQREVLESAARILAGAARLAGRRTVTKSALASTKSGIGGFIAAGFAVALVAGAAYVAWQVLRTDDGAWVDDEFDVD